MITVTATLRFTEIPAGKSWPDAYKHFRFELPTLGERMGLAEEHANQICINESAKTGKPLFVSNIVCSNGDFICNTLPMFYTPAVNIREVEAEVEA